MKRTNKWIIRAIVAVLVVLIVAAFTFLMMPSKQRKLRLSVGNGVHYGQLIIAVEKGFIQNYVDVEIEMSMLVTGPEKLEAMVANRLDFGVMGVPPAIIGITKMPVKILASQGEVFRGLWTWREDINSPEDFKEGDKVNFVGTGTTIYVSMVKYFTSIGRTKEDVDKIMVNLKYTESFQAMEQREIDGDFVHTKWNLAYDAIPDCKCIISEGDIWDMAGLVLVGREAYVTENPDITDAVLKGYIDAQNFIEKHPEEALEIIRQFLGWDEPGTFEGVNFDYTYGLEALVEISDVMYELGLSDNTLTLEDILFESIRNVL